MNGLVRSAIHSGMASRTPERGSWEPTRYTEIREADSVLVDHEDMARLVELIASDVPSSDKNCARSSPPMPQTVLTKKTSRLFV